MNFFCNTDYEQTQKSKLKCMLTVYPRFFFFFTSQQYVTFSLPRRVCKCV